MEWLQTAACSDPSHDLTANGHQAVSGGLFYGKPMTDFDAALRKPWSDDDEKIAGPPAGRDAIRPWFPSALRQCAPQSAQALAEACLEAIRAGAGERGLRVMLPGRAEGGHAGHDGPRSDIAPPFTLPVHRKVGQVTLPERHC